MAFGVDRVVASFKITTELFSHGIYYTNNLHAHPLHNRASAHGTQSETKNFADYVEQSLAKNNLHTHTYTTTHFPVHLPFKQRGQSWRPSQFEISQFMN